MKFLFITLLMISAPAMADNSVNHEAHVIIHGAVSGASYVAFKRNGYTKNESYLYAVAASMAVGFTSESYKSFREISHNDKDGYTLNKNALGLDLLGALIGPVLVWEF